MVYKLKDIHVEIINIVYYKVLETWNYVDVHRIILLISKIFLNVHGILM